VRAGQMTAARSQALRLLQAAANHG
jgi:hypothetical protein